MAVSTLQLSHGADGAWFIVEPRAGQTALSIVNTPITNEMAVEGLLDADRRVILINTDTLSIEELR
jgi:hypothetical protein